MSHPSYLREAARRLRIEQHLTLDQIAARLALPRTTIYGWIRDLPAVARPSRTEGQRRGTRAMQVRYRTLRVEAYERGTQEFAALARDPSFRDFVCLYLAEGCKRNRNRVAVGNSDPAVVRVCTRWMREFAARPLRFSLQYHVDQDLDELTRFWAETVGVACEEIRLQRKSNSGRLAGRQWRSRWGVLTVWAHDTQFRARLQAWLDLLRESWV